MEVYVGNWVEVVVVFAVVQMATGTNWLRSD